MPHRSIASRRSTLLLILLLAPLLRSESPCAEDTEDCPSGLADHIHGSSQGGMDIPNSVLEDIKEDLGCYNRPESERPVPFPSEVTWMFMREMYHSVVGPNLSSIAPLSRVDGFAVPTEVGHVEEVEEEKETLGVYATEFVQKGQLIWRGRQQAQFPDAASYRRFLVLLPVYLACDALSWSFLEEFVVGRRICLDLDAGALLRSDNKESNAHCSSSKCVATRDINPKEEVLYAEIGVLKQFSNKLGCYELSMSGLPFHSKETWMFMREVYHDIVGPDLSSIAPLSHDDGFGVPITVARSPGKGRGVFATGFVPAGQVIWSPRQRARFPDRDAFGSFLASLSVDLACEVCMWSYTDDDDDGVISIYTDLDDASLMNEDDDEPNTQCAWSPNGCVASRDIHPGEEVLCRYSDFDSGH